MMRKSDHSCSDSTLDTKDIRRLMEVRLGNGRADPGNVEVPLFTGEGHDD